MKIAVIGSGISGLGAAWLLNHNGMDVTVYEADNRIGGHANTVKGNGQHADVDTGFIVYNEWTYPNLIALFDHLNVPTRASNMSFAISARGGALEYSSDALFCQKKNLLSPSYYRMLYDLVRFYRAVPRDYDTMNDHQTLGDYLRNNRYSDIFINDHLIPMGAAIWSMGAEDMKGFPIKSFARFCMNHGLLNIVNRPQWRTVEGGSRTYVDIISAPFKNKIRIDTPVTSITRNDDKVIINDDVFDQVIIATHSDQALKMLEDADAQERAVLGQIGYSANIAVLHRDAAQMPVNRKAWASWNYLTGNQNSVTLTYWMNKLQTFLPDRDDLFVTLNPVTPIDEKKIISTQTYHHPCYTKEAMAAQKQIKTIQGNRNTWFCGAWCGYGFHEDGLASGLAVAEMATGIKRPWGNVPEKSSALGNIKT